MTRRYDRQKTTDLLLEAGVDEFAEMGVHGARVDRIAAAAGANKAAIYTYFGNKEQFFTAAVGQVMEELASGVTVTPNDLPGYAVRLFDYVCAHPEAAKLFSHEAMHYAGHVHDVPAFQERSAFHAERVALLAAGAGPGEDAKSLFMAIQAMVYWFVAAPQVVRMIYGPDPEDARQRYRAFLLSTVRKLTT